MEKALTQDIQEMLEGLLNDEQTAEVLHRLSVSPEKLVAFRQHMALQGAFDRDGRANEMTEEEDNAVWAAVLGATGGVVTGGAATGASSWLGRAAAFVATGIAGFFIGTAADVDLPQNDSTAQKAPAAATQSVSESAPVASRIDTVIKTVIQPQIIYRDRVEYRDRIAPAPLAAEERQQPEPTVIALNQNLVGNGAQKNTAASRPYGISAEARKNLAALSSRKTSTDIADATSPNAKNPNLAPEISNDDGERASTSYSDPNKVLHASAENKEELSAKSSDGEASVSDSEKKVSSISLLQNGWEIAYNERVGRITPLPTGLNEVDPNFGGRALDLSYHLLEGRLGIGGRLMYGSFSRVTLKEEKWFALGEEESKFSPVLGIQKGFGTELFVNYRLPLFSDRLAIAAEVGAGATSTHTKVGWDLSFLYLITGRLGAQIGAGQSFYFYNTEEVRQNALQQFENTGTTSDLQDVYKGSMLEGRYGLFFRF